MSDREQSNRPTPPEPPPYADDAGLRETYLFELREDDQETLRHLAAVFVELARESALLSPDAGNLGAALDAVVADLDRVRQRGCTH